ncbi:MAG: hypothetical protein EPN75_08765 [Beijerinckiaceae bacterium]|nr:MAG: hypothetical protein EPN75_08765 [Beijerinckiaceae bacterium]
MNTSPTQSSETVEDPFEEIKRHPYIAAATTAADLNLLVGLTPEQAAALRSMAFGHDTVLSGAGGTGKSMVMTRWLNHLNASAPEIDIHLISLTPEKILPGATAFRHTEILEAANLTATSTRKTILAIDEYGHLPDIDFGILDGYDQIIATGDPYQDSSLTGGRATRFVAFIKAIGGDAHILDIAWRGAGLQQTSTIDAYTYRNQHASMPIYKREYLDILKYTMANDDPLEVAMKLLARLVRNNHHNSDFTYWIALRNRDVIAQLKRLAPAFPFNPKRKLKFTIIDPVALQGLETEILLVYAPDFDRICTSPQYAARTIINLLGRTTDHLEVIFAKPADSELSQKAYFSTLLKCVLQFEILPTLRTTDPEIAALADKIKALGLTVIPLGNGYMIYKPEMNKPSIVVAPIDDAASDGQILTQLFDQAILKQRGWAVSHTLKPVLPYFETNIPVIKGLTRPVKQSAHKPKRLTKTG